MYKIKLIDFLSLVNFKYSENNTSVIRIYYPDKDKPNEIAYSEDRYFEYGVYDYSIDTKKRLIQTINNWILNCFVSDVYFNNDNEMLEICVVMEDEIDDLNLDYQDYELEGDYKNKKIETRRVYICSPYSENPELSTKNTQRYCRFASLQGYIPIAPHIYFTQFLNNDNEREKEKGMNFGLELLEKCDTVWIFSEYGISEGMEKEIRHAKDLNIPICYFNNDKELLDILNLSKGE